VSAGPATAVSAPRPRDVGVHTIAAAIAALERLHDRLDGAFDLAAERLIQLDGKVVTLGVGKSGHAAAKVAATLRSVGLPAVSLHAADSMHGDLGMVARGDVAMLFSKSGSTQELMAVVPHLRARGVTLIGVVGSVSSPLALQSDIVLDASVEREGCPLDAAPMASVIVAQALGDALAAAIVRARGFTSDDYARLHPAGALGVRLSLTVGDVMRRGHDLPVVNSAASLKDAVIEITRTGYGAVCVLADGGRLAGFLTDGDIRRSLLEVDDVASVAVADLMTRAPLTVSPELPLSEALLGLEQRRKPFLTAPVVDGADRCVGLLRLHDTVRAHLPA
jgi:arabinose-5-phosphate isomerase